MTAKDENDRLKEGTLPADPADGTRVLAEGPRLRTAHDLLAGTMARVYSREERRFSPTGHGKIDEMTGGFLPGWCWVIGADTGVGKSSLAIAFVDTVLRSGRGAIIISVEDPEELYGDRLMLRRGRRGPADSEKINADRLRLRNLNETEKQLVMDVVNKAERKPIYLDAIGRSAEWIANALAKMLDELPDVDLVILDYIGETRSQNKNQDRRNEVSEVGKLVRGVVKSRKRCIVMLSQLTIDDPKKFPRRNQIRESRDIVNAAEVVGLLAIAEDDIKMRRKYTDQVGNTQEREDTVVRAGKRGFLLDKVKQGRTGFVEMIWDDDAACFVDAEVMRNGDKLECIEANPGRYDHLADGIPDRFCGPATEDLEGERSYVQVDEDGFATEL
jgi:replicative DNA helicase